MDFIPFVIEPIRFIPVRDLSKRDAVKIPACGSKFFAETEKYVFTRMWANAQRDGRPAEHGWRPLFNAAKFGADAHY